MSLALAVEIFGFVVSDLGLATQIPVSGLINPGFSVKVGQVFQIMTGREGTFHTYLMTEVGQYNVVISGPREVLPPITP